MAETNMELYTFDKLCEFVAESYTRYMAASEAGTQSEREKEMRRKDTLRESALSCFAGIEKDKNLVKQFIQRVLTGNLNMLLDGWPQDFKIDVETIHNVFPWDTPYRLHAHIKFLGLVYHWKETLGGDAFADMISRYGLTNLRKLNTIQGDERETIGMYIDESDINVIFEGDNIHFNYDLALDVLVQMIYEEFKGNGCIDELLYQRVDDVGIGVSGLPDDIEPVHLRGKKVAKAYDGAWVKVRGKLINLKFLSFGSFENLTRVVRQLVMYDMQGAFSEREGRKLGYGKDGSRRTSVITPFGENPAAWVRKFTAKDFTNQQLVTFSERGRKIENWALLTRIERALVKGGATIPICGPQGAGKTTKLEAISEYIQNFYAIRMIESEFEARIRWRYPEKNIFTMQTTSITPEEAYEFSLRTSGDIYIVSEVRSDQMMVNITRTANRGGRSVIFTYHPNKPRATVIEIANSLIRQKLYTSLKDAMYTTLDVVKCCIHIDVDLEYGCRYYNIFEYRPVKVDLADSFLGMQGGDRSEEFMRTTYTFFEKMVGDEYFTVVPIITFNTHTGEYEFKNTISNGFYDELILKSGLHTEKEEIMKIFRPMEYLRLFAEKKKIRIVTEEQFSHYIEELNLNTALMSFEECGKWGS
jgi:pilus assembly protein CpaF